MQPGVQATLVARVAHEDPLRGAEPRLRRVWQLLQAGGTSTGAHQRSPSEAQAVQLRGESPYQFGVKGLVYLLQQSN